MIKKELIHLEIKMNNKEDILDYMITNASTLDLLEDGKRFKTDVYEREEMLPTSIGFKVAIPHGRSKGVKAPFVSFMKTETPFLWDDRNDNLVDFIFLIAIPKENENNLHLRLLAEVSKRLMNEDYREALRTASSIDEAYELLNEINERI